MRNTNMVIKELIDSRVTHPDSWVPYHETDKIPFEDDMPADLVQSNAIMLFQWDHKQNNNKVELMMGASEEGEPFSITLDWDGKNIHGHGSPTLDAACEAASALMYMSNHMESVLSTQKSIDDIENDLRKAEEEALQYKQEAQIHRNDLEEVTQKYNSLKEVYDQLNEDYKEMEAKNESQIEMIDQAREERDSLRNRLDEANAMLRTYMNVRMYEEYDDGYHGIVHREQTWRPPYYDELMDLAHHIEQEWQNNELDKDDSPSETTRNIISSSYIIILEEFIPQGMAYSGKMMFVVHTVESYYTAFIWKEEGGFTEVEQHTDVRSEDN